MNCNQSECIESYNKAMKSIYKDYHIGWNAEKELGEEYDDELDFFHCCLENCHEILPGDKVFRCEQCHGRFCMKHLKLDPEDKDDDCPYCTRCYETNRAERDIETLESAVDDFYVD